jgi:hypothetical protein
MVHTPHRKTSLYSNGLLVTGKLKGGKIKGINNEIFFVLAEKNIKIKMSSLIWVCK